ncbi:MAG: thermopsin, partial [Thermoplasmata archaeon]|nr:thermopsin [Thermoplasmata archaeon]
YIDGDGADMFGIQLNTVLDNVSISGNSSYQFWTQNFVSYTPSSGWLIFGDNVWNFSSRSGYFPANSIASHGPNGTLADSLVYFAPGPSFTIHYPFTVTFYNNASLVGGRSALFFNYTVSNATTSHSGSFDQLVFNSNLTRLGGPARVPQFQVKGQSYDPIGLVNDIELDVVGNDDGDTTAFTAVNATLTIASWSSTLDSYVSVPSAVNAGTDTGETSTGLAVFWNGTSDVAEMLPGPSILTGLWNVSGTSGERHVHLTLTPANAFVFVCPGSFFNASLAQWVPATSSPLDLYLPNVGTYDVLTELSGFDPVNQSVNSSANSTTAIVVSLTSDPSRGVYTPLYAWDNSELSAISSSGSGTPASPYALENYQPTSLAPEFAQWNDFEYPVFSGIQLVHTTDSVTITPPSFEINYPSWMLPELLGYGQPTTNDLQLLFFEVTNVTLRGGSAISGWLSAFVGGFPEAAVIFWNSSDNLVAANNFDDEGGALSFFGGTANTVWGNWFLPETPNATNPNFVYDSGANETALNLSENGDLLYNNAFLTPIDAVTPTENALSCQIACQPAVYADSWNVSEQPASNWTYLHGVNLTGSIVSTTYQGGNYWWNYGSVADPYDALPYNDSGLITVRGDYLPLTFATLFGVSFKETGLAPGTSWSVDSEGVDQSSTSTTVTLLSPDGTYSYSVGAVPGYTIPSAGSFTVGGANVTVVLPFRLDYTITFTATGLTAAQNWSLTITNARHAAFSGSNPGTTPIVAALDNGSYAFTVGAVVGFTPSPLGGSFNVAGGPVSQTIQFTQNRNTTYAVTFMESGLANGTPWSVGLQGETWNATTPTLTLNESNKSYSFDIVPVPGYTSAPAGVVLVQVAGAPVDVAITFSLFSAATYPVTFHEVGLVGGTNWSVQLGETAFPSPSSTLVVPEPNGVYTFVVAPVAGYGVSPTTFVLQVLGAAVDAPAVTFTPVGAVVVHESGLPSTVPWTWSVSGTNGSAWGQANASAALEDGQYEFVASAVGYRATPSSGPLNVSGFGASYLNITFAPISGTSPTSGSNASAPSLFPEYAIVGLFVLAAVLLIGMIYYRQRALSKPPPPPEPYVSGLEAGPSPPPPAPPRTP